MTRDPDFSGQPVISGPDAARENCAAPTDAPRRHPGFRLSRQSDRAGVYSAPARLPECRPGTWLRTTLAGAASCPAFQTPLDDALATDRTLRTYHEQIGSQ